MSGGIDPEIDAALGRTRARAVDPVRPPPPPDPAPQAAPDRAANRAADRASGRAADRAPDRAQGSGLTPDHNGDLSSELRALHAELKDDRAGAVATYIPALAEADPDHFAISVATVSGETLGVGDTAERFTLQSIVAPFLYGAVLDGSGRASVLERVGVEPSGNPFHEIVFSTRDNRPTNPMVNSGMLAVASMLPGATPSERLAGMLDHLALFMGRRPEVDMRAYVSEKTTAHRNRSIAHLLRNAARIDGEVEPLLDLYTQACSVAVTSEDLALMAATLANAGVNPRTGERALRGQSLRDVLTVMFTCGLYEASGLWAYRVGVPAKSGVAGGIIAVVPGVMGVGVYSPRLDESGNSARGMQACDRLVGRLGLHVFGGRHAEAAIDRPIEDMTEADMIHGREWVHESPESPGESREPHPQAPPAPPDRPGGRA